MGSIKTWAADDSNRSKALYLLVIKLLITLYAFVLAYTLLVGFTTRSQFVFRFVALRTFLHSLVWFFYSSRREEQNTDMKIIDNFSYDPWDWSLVWSKRAEEQKLLQVKHLVPAGVEAGGEDANGKYILAPSAFVGLSPKVASSAIMGLPTVASSAFSGLPKEKRIEDFTTRATPVASMPPVKMDSTAEVTAPQRPATTSVVAVTQRPAAATSTAAVSAKPPKQTGNEEIRLRKKQKKKEKKLKKRERIRLRKLEEGGEESMSSASSTASSSDADTTTLEVNTAEYA